MIRCLLFALVLLVAQQITLFGDEVEVYDDCLIWSYAPQDDLHAIPGNGKYGYLDKGGGGRTVYKYKFIKFENSKGYKSVFVYYNYAYFSWYVWDRYTSKDMYKWVAKRKRNKKFISSGFKWHNKIAFDLYRNTDSCDFYWAERFSDTFGTWANVVDQIEPSVEVCNNGNIGVLYPLRLMNTFNYSEVNYSKNNETKVESKCQVFGLGKYFNATARKLSFAMNNMYKKPNGYPYYVIRTTYNGLEPTFLTKEEAVQCSFFLKPLLFEVSYKVESIKKVSTCYKMQCVFQVPPLDYFYQDYRRKDHSLSRKDLYYTDKELTQWNKENTNWSSIPDKKDLITKMNRLKVGFLYSTDFLGETSDWSNKKKGLYMYGHNNVCFPNDIAQLPRGTYVKLYNDPGHKGATRRVFWGGGEKYINFYRDVFTSKRPILLRNGLVSKYNPVLVSINSKLCSYIVNGIGGNKHYWTGLGATCPPEANIAACTINQKLFVYMVPSPKTALNFPKEDSYKYYLCLGSYKYYNMSQDNPFCHKDKHTEDGDIPQNALIGIGTDKDTDSILEQYTFGVVAYQEPTYCNNYIVYAWCEGKNVHIGAARFCLNKNQCVQLYTKRDDIQEEFGFSFPACRIISVKIVNDRLWIFYFSADHYDFRCFNVPMSEVLKYSAS